MSLSSEKELNSKIQIGEAASAAGNGSSPDFRHQLGAQFDFSNLMAKPNGQEFFTRGRMNGFKNGKPGSALAPEKRAIIDERIKIEEAGGEWMRYGEIGLTPQDMMALVKEGTQTPAPDLSKSIRGGKSARAIRCGKNRIIKKWRRRRSRKMEPDCICTPSNRDELVQFVQYTAKHKIPLTPRGRGTWTLGGALATKGGLILNLANFEKTIEAGQTSISSSTPISARTR